MAPAATTAEGVAAVALAGAGEKPCKFGAACTRPNCVFVHPWDVRGDPAAQVNCRYGAACTRADCHFKHPAHRPAPYNRHKFSATFNKHAHPAPGSAAAEGKAGDSGAIAPKPSESAEHISERLKRFAAAGGEGAASGSGEVERIVPGQQEQSQQGKSTTAAAGSQGGKNVGGGDEGAADKVEIPLDEDAVKTA